MLVPGSIRVEILSTQFGRAMVDNEENEKMMNHTDVTTRHTSLSAAAAAAADTVATVLDGRVPLMEPHFGVEYWVYIALPQFLPHEANKDAVSKSVVLLVLLLFVSV